MAKSYVPDLKEHFSLCEFNYLRLEKLLRLLDDKQSIDLVTHLPVSSTNASQASPDGFGTSAMTIELIDKARFTTTVKLVQRDKASELIACPSIVVCLYHDARMAEVVRFQDQRVVKGRHSYPNQKMFLPDEKIQINRFLGQWLQLCFSHGMADVQHAYS